jgi:hypothetical protein
MARWQCEVHKKDGSTGGIQKEEENKEKGSRVDTNRVGAWCPLWTHALRGVDESATRVVEMALGDPLRSKPCFAQSDDCLDATTRRDYARQHLAHALELLNEKERIERMLVRLVLLPIAYRVRPDWREKLRSILTQNVIVTAFDVHEPAWKEWIEWMARTSCSQVMEDVLALVEPCPASSPLPGTASGATASSSSSSVLGTSSVQSAPSERVPARTAAQRAIEWIKSTWKQHQDEYESKTHDPIGDYRLAQGMCTKDDLWFHPPPLTLDDDDDQAMTTTADSSIQNKAYNATPIVYLDDF